MITVTPKTALAAFIVGLLLTGCAKAPPTRCYVVLGQIGVAAEVCETGPKLTLLGEPTIETSEIPAYVKGLLAIEGIAYLDDELSVSIDDSALASITRMVENEMEYSDEPLNYLPPPGF